MPSPFVGRAQMFNGMTCMAKGKGDVRAALKHCEKGLSIMLHLAGRTVGPRAHRHRGGGAKAGGWLDRNKIVPDNILRSKIQAWAPSPPFNTNPHQPRLLPSRTGTQQQESAQPFPSSHTSRPHFPPMQEMIPFGGGKRGPGQHAGPAADVLPQRVRAVLHAGPPRGGAQARVPRPADPSGAHPQH